MKRLAVLFITLLIASFAFVGFVNSNATYAQGATGDIEINVCPSGAFEPLCNIGFDGDLISTVVTLAFIIASLLALGFLIYGGIRWITSGGDKAGVESARNIIIAALVGLVITFLSYLILSIVFNIFNIGFDDLDIPSIEITEPAEEAGE